MHVQPITFEEFFEHPCTPEMLDAYALESAIEGMPRPSPNPEVYKAMGASGALTLLAATEGDVLVGFITVLVYPNPHYNVMLGVAESYFVTPAARSTGAGVALREAAERHAAERGALGLLISAPAHGRLARVMERTPAYEESNRVFFKRLVA